MTNPRTARPRFALPLAPRRIALWLTLLMLGGVARADITVPSGQDITLGDVFFETQKDGELWLRLRFLAPGIGAGQGKISYEQAEEDFLYLCQSEALPRLEAVKTRASVIVITLMDRMVEFGASDPAAVQYFEAFRPEGGACLWEPL